MSKLDTFSQRLAQLRREKAAREVRNIDQEEIAKAIGLSEKQQPYISKWENDTTPKDDDLVQRLADYYGVTFLWLRHGKGERSPQSSAADGPPVAKGFVKASSAENDAKAKKAKRRRA